MKTYEVNFVIEIEAESEEDAHEEAIEDVKALIQDGSLSGDVKELG